MMFEMIVIRPLLLLSFLLLLSVVPFAEGQENVTSSSTAFPEAEGNISSSATASPDAQDTYVSSSATTFASPESTTTSTSSTSASTCYPASLKVSAAATRHRLNGPRLIIAHRGASAHIPEHTLEAYRLALELGADFVEPDVVATKDGHLISIHTMDLNITTDVMDVFGSTHEPWFSPFANRTGYWTFNFTLEEIKQLRVKQRIPEARTTLYDGLFQIPTLEEIVQVVNQWNNDHVPLYIDLDAALENSKLDRDTLVALQRSGIYAELKEVAWLQQDANMDLVELFFQHFDQYSGDWNETLFRPDDCKLAPKFDQYKVPGLVIQSFDGDSLEHFSRTWKQHEGTLYNVIPEPPYILLLSHPDCWEDDFWFNLGETWRSTISGIGCDKKCLLNEVEGRAFLNKAEEFNMVLHPYTERPEQEFVSKSVVAQDEAGNDLDTMAVPKKTIVIDETGEELEIGNAAQEGMVNGGLLEELKVLFCEKNVKGIFIEAVSYAVLVAAAGCEEPLPATKGTLVEGEGGDLEGNTGLALNTTSNTPSLEGNNICHQNTFKDIFYLALGSFFVGVVSTICFVQWLNRKFAQRRGQRTASAPVATDDDTREGDDRENEMI